MKGGRDLSDDQNVFRFDLNESLYFEKGQEVAEMIGISLDPEISIQSYDDYVSIRGVIELVGEYRKSPSYLQEDKDEVLYFNDNHSKRFIEVVEDTVDDRAIFSHRFPVEISVPAYRINDINDVNVNIESFDYELPSEDQLIIKSKVDIYGIHDESQPLRSVEEDQNMTEDGALDIEESLGETFQFDVTEQREIDDEIEQRSDQEVLDRPQTDELEEIEVSQDEPDDEKESGRWKTKTQTFDEFFSKNVDSDEDGMDVALHEDHAEDFDEELDFADHEESTSDYDEDDDRENDQSPKDVNYLASIFRNEEDEEEIKYTKMRLCIVQADDTLEKIAERYKVTTMQLLKKNALEDDNVNEGQLLYIPSKNTSLDYE